MARPTDYAPTWMRRRLRRLRVQRPVDLGDLDRLQPIDPGWGFERGRPIDRAYVERFLDENRDAIHGRVLEVVGSAYTRRFGSNVDRCDVLDIDPHNASATIVADLADAPQLPTAAFDCVVLTHVLQFVPDPQAALRTIGRILAPGGALLLTVPGIAQLSRAEEATGGDWWRFTPRSLRRWIEENVRPRTVVVSAHGNVLTGAALLYGLAREDLRPDAFAHDDPLYPVVIGARAEKATS